MNFEFVPLRAPNFRIELWQLEDEIQKLKRRGDRMENREMNRSDSLVAMARKQIRTGFRSGKNFEEYSVMKRRDWLLLKLYLADLTRDEERKALPPLDDKIIIAILGSNPLQMGKHLRTLATQLYFTHFGRDRLPCLETLSHMLKLAWSREKANQKLHPSARIWAENAEMLFCLNAPDRVAELWEPGKSVQDLADDFHISSNGLFCGKLHQSLILQRLRKLPLNTRDAALEELVQREKERMLDNGLCLGAAAVQILVQRSQNENGSTVPENWSTLLVSYACDPRSPDKNSQGTWWGWATPTEKEVALRALTALSLHEFIKLLERSLIGTAQAHQFPARKKMLLRLFELGKVIDARLAIDSSTFSVLNKETHKILKPKQVSSNQTSFICLRCADNVYLIEGTHSFALRGFCGGKPFPVPSIWTGIQRIYSDREFRPTNGDCDIYQKHQGNWQQGFVNQLRKYRIEWRGLT